MEAQARPSFRSDMTLTALKPFALLATLETASLRGSLAVFIVIFTLLDSWRVEHSYTSVVGIIVDERGSPAAQYPARSSPNFFCRLLG